MPLQVENPWGVGVKQGKLNMGERVGYFSGLTFFTPGLLSAFYNNRFYVLIHVRLDHDSGERQLEMCMIIQC